MEQQFLYQLELAYLHSFSNLQKEQWGAFVWNTEMPDYYDANHAHIIQEPKNPKDTVSNIILFYESKNLIPRCYIYNFDERSLFATILKENLFKIETFENPVQKWNGKVYEHEQTNNIRIELVTESNFEQALHILTSIKELGGQSAGPAMRREFANPSFSYFLLYLNDNPACVATIFEHEHLARLESVATKEEYRGKGLIGAMISHLQKIVQEKNIIEFLVFPINERVEKVYQRYGFDTIDSISSAHAFLGGKSITEIRE